MGIDFWIAALIASVFTGMGKVGVPVITAMAVPIMALTISPVVAAGILLPVFVVADVFGIIAYRNTFNRDVIKILGVAMPIGVLSGYLTANTVNDAAVTLLVGVIGLVFALTWLIRRPVDGPPRKARWGGGLFWGTITGFTSFVSHSGAAPYQVYTMPLRMTKLTFAGTVTIAFAYINFVKLIPYYMLGQLSLANLKIAGILMIPAALGVALGFRLVRVVPEKLFFQVVVWALLLLSIRLIWQAVTSL